MRYPQKKTRWKHGHGPTSGRPSGHAVRFWLWFDAITVPMQGLVHVNFRSECAVLSVLSEESGCIRDIRCE